MFPYSSFAYTTITHKYKYLKRILIAPLNWGLGHATRCMPIINELLARNCEVIIASDGRALHLLRAEYPKLTALELPAYNVSYRFQNMMTNIAPQVFKIMRAIQREHLALQEIIKHHKIDAVISDNRYGCYSGRAEVPAVFMSHQLNIKINQPMIEKGVAVVNRQLIQRFDACWIPDCQDQKMRLSGILSDDEPYRKLIQTKYLGALTRMRHYETTPHRDLLIILSGPEPQRTYFERILFEQVGALPSHLKILIVKGKTDVPASMEAHQNISFCNFMTANQLNQAILESQYVVTRSGYSTIMDLAVLGTKALLVPTPGQTEQEYLARHFHAANVYLAQPQNALNLSAALEQLPQYTGLQRAANNNLSAVIKTFLDSLSA